MPWSLVSAHFLVGLNDSRRNRLDLKLNYRLVGALHGIHDDDIQLVTVGYGMGNLNDHLMEQLADRGDGMYAYIDRFEECASTHPDSIAVELVGGRACY